MSLPEKLKKKTSVDEVKTRIMRTQALNGHTIITILGPDKSRI